MVWHVGERELQRLEGVEDLLGRVGPKLIRPFMPKQHQVFFESLPFLVLAGLDAAGRPWASLRAGPPGFAHAPDETRLLLEAEPDPTDPLDPREGDPIALLGIEPHTRRRNRANGQVLKADTNAIEVRVTQSFGNCPKYITPRAATYAPEGIRRTDPELTSEVDDEARALITASDTFFVASHFEGGLDVSHRGGPAGFVQIQSDGSLRIPDYSGNRFFNTLGNFMRNPVAGLLFLDMVERHALHLTGRVQIDFQPTETAKRHWIFKPLEVRRRRTAVPLLWRNCAPQEANAKTP